MGVFFSLLEQLRVNMKLLWKVQFSLLRSCVVRGRYGTVGDLSRSTNR